MPSLCYAESGRAGVDGERDLLACGLLRAEVQMVCSRGVVVDGGEPSLELISSATCIPNPPTASAALHRCSRRSRLSGLSSNRAQKIYTFVSRTSASPSPCSCCSGIAKPPRLSRPNVAYIIPNLSSPHLWSFRWQNPSDQK